MIWEAALGVGVLKASVLLALWFNRRRIAARFAPPLRLDTVKLARHIGHELGLAPADKEELELWLSGYTHQVDELRHHNAELRYRLLDAVAGEAMDKMQLNEVYTDKRALVEQAYVHLRDRFLAFHARLTPDQRSKLAGLMERNAAHPLFSHPLLP
jgi:uncharacterized membrane protein